MLRWGGLGSLLFTGLLFLLRAFGVFEAARDREGNFRSVSFKSLVGFASVSALMVGFPALASAAILDGAISLLGAWGVAYGIFFVVNLYDFVVLDYLVVVRWHPAFLNLPDTDYYRTTRPHAAGFARGALMGIPATLVSAGLAVALA